MNILITGCNGQLGNEIQLLEKDYPQHNFFNTDVAELDISDKKAVADFIKDFKIDGVINCAAYTAVDKAESDIEKCEQLNAKAPFYLAESIDKRNGWMIQISTDYVFDGTNNRPYTEYDLANPMSVYGSTKRGGEQNVINMCKNVVVIRTAWLYSSFGNNFVKTMLRLGKEKNEIGVVADQIGTPTYARDLAVAIMQIVNKAIVPGIYHYTNEGVASWFDFAKMIHQIAGIENCKVKPLRTEEYPTAAARPSYSVLDKSLIKETFGLEIPYWVDSLRECIDKLI